MNLRTTIDWLEKRPALNLGLVLGYLGVILALHDAMASFSVWIVAEISLPVYDVVVGSVALAIILGAGFVLVRNGLRYRNRIPLQLILAVGTLVLLVAHSRVLSVMNIEAIHFVQFMLLAILVFPLFRRALPTLALTLVFAFVDEVYQYILLYPERESYLDFNDVVMDLYGMGMGMVFLLNANVRWKPPRKFWSSPVLWLWVGILGLVGIQLLTGNWAWYNTGQEGVGFYFNEGPPDAPAWVEFYSSGIYFYILSPWQGILLLLGLLGFYSLADRKAKKPSA